jgi:hypothetical protein
MDAQSAVEVGGSADVGAMNPLAKMNGYSHTGSRRCGRGAAAAQAGEGQGAAAPRREGTRAQGTGGTANGERVADTAVFIVY